MKIERIGSIYGFAGGSFAGMVFSPDGIAPTVKICGGGYSLPLIFEAYED